MTKETKETMYNLYQEEGYNPDELTHPRDVEASDIGDDSVVIAYTAVRNPDPDAPSTMYALREFDIDDVVPTEEVEEYTDGAVTYTDETPVTHGVVWSYRVGDVPNFASIGYGEEMYDGDEFQDPNRWDRTVKHVRGLSDDFIRFDL